MIANQQNSIAVCNPKNFLKRTDILSKPIRFTASKEFLQGYSKKSNAQKS
jgi:hypothetical protein